jgi:hypothetical protein
MLKFLQKFSMQRLQKEIKKKKAISLFEHSAMGTVVTQFKNLNFNSRYRHESAPNVNVLAASLGTKGWGW